MNKKIINWSIYAILGLLIFSFLMIDYFVLKPALDVNTGIGYWIGTGITVLLILITMTLVRFTEKQKMIANNKHIQNYQNKLTEHFKIITNNALYDDLEDFIKDYNEKVKYSTFLKQIDKKISKCKNLEKKKELIELRKTPKEEVLKMNIKYTKISSSHLYSNVFSKENDDPNDIVAKDFLDLIKMLLTKATPMIIGALFTVSVGYDFIFHGASALFGTLMKIVIISTSIISAISHTEKYVNGTLENVLRKRIRISISFIYSNEKIKQTFLGENITEKELQEHLEEPKEELKEQPKEEKEEKSE